ncbi:MAG: VWA-like domain-containing protein [Myxococcota bacterium]|nr:VWA-like domain-containing protein [Myxococcota bacterium]
MNAQHREAWDELARSINQLILEEPFYGHLFSSVIRDITPTTPTMAVGVEGARIALQVNPEFLLNLTFHRGNKKYRSERVAVIKHEALHLVFKHIFRRENREPRMYNLAADIVVNQFVKPWKLPEGGITLETFPDLELEPDQTLDWYYGKLQELSRKPQSAPQSSEVLGRLLSQEDATIVGDPASGLMRGDHRLWGKSHDIDAQVADSVLDRLIVQAKERAGQRGWGALPNQIRELISAAIERRKPKLDWRRVIRIFAASSRKTRVVNTIRRQSKRYGTYPGIRVSRFQRLVVAVDTSGSVSDSDLSEFFSEIHGIWRQGAEITVVECDAAVQRTYPYTGVLPKRVAGRGGTVFDPVFVWLNSNRMVRYDGCIYLTDGYASAPSIKPPCKMLWVVTSDGQLGEHLKFGRAIQLPTR